jgi:hypothetical protein
MNSNRFYNENTYEKAPQSPSARLGPWSSATLQEYIANIVTRIISDLYTIYTFGHPHGLLSIGMMIFIVLTLSTILNFLLSLIRIFAFLYVVRLLANTLPRRYRSTRTMGSTWPIRRRSTIEDQKGYRVKRHFRSHRQSNLSFKATRSHARRRHFLLPVGDGPNSF